MDTLEGQLFQLPNGRWLFAPVGHYELTSGDPVELWDGEQFKPTRIEHSHAEGGYYAVNGIPLKDGNYARIKK